MVPDFENEKNYLIVGPEGVITNRKMEPWLVLSILLHAYLRIWKKEKGNINILDAAYKIIDMLNDMTEEENTIGLDKFAEIINTFFRMSDDEEGNG